MSEKRYSERTVIRAQRKVLRMALDTLGQMPGSEIAKLRVVGKGGLITLGEVMAHITAAIQLKVKR